MSFDSDIVFTYNLLALYMSGDFEDDDRLSSLERNAYEKLL